MKEVLDLLEQAKAKGGITLETTETDISYCDEHYVMSTEEIPIVVCEPAITISRLD